jgi:hypothetical protein
MGMLDGLLGQIGANVDIENLATKIGLPPEQVEQAVHALGMAHPEPGDTAEIAAQQTGLPTDKLQEIIGHIGGEGSLAQFSSLLQGEGGIMGKLGGLASGLFGKS